jgi:hypothetical protein
MKKILISAFVIGAFGVLLFIFFDSAKAPSKPLGISANDIAYRSATNSSVSCSSATSTVVLGADPARTSFVTTNDSTNTVYLCKTATGCLASTGIRLNASGGSFEQDDAYVGAYSCIASTATSVITTITSD